MRRPALFLAYATLLAGCEVPSLGMPDPVSKEGQHINSLWSGFIVASFIVFGLVVGLILYAAIRFRRKNDDLPSQKPYNIPIEVLYTVTPIVVVAALFGFSVATQLKVTRSTPQAEAVIVNVTGFQWGWRFEFPEQRKVVEGAGEVPAHARAARRPHRALEADLPNDVIHSFWVPHFIEKRDLIPGIDNTIDVDITQARGVGGRVLGVLRARPLADELQRAGGAPEQIRRVAGRGRQDVTIARRTPERRRRAAGARSTTPPGMASLVSRPPTTSASASPTWSPRSCSSSSAARWPS